MKISKNNIKSLPNDCAAVNGIQSPKHPHVFIFPENKASIRIHEKCGFRIIGYREKIGKMGDIWRDNLMLERRSRLVGQS